MKPFLPFSPDTCVYQISVFESDANLNDYPKTINHPRKSGLPKSWVSRFFKKKKGETG